MFRNYFKTAWRNIIRTIGYSTLNVSGLAMGMAVALLIGLWVYYQYSFDKFLPEYKSIYRVQRNFESNGDTLTFQTTSLKLAEALHSQIPEIQYVAQSDWMGSHGLNLHLTYLTHLTYFCTFFFRPIFFRSSFFITTILKEDRRVTLVFTGNNVEKIG
jgi:hypothetical protein